MFHKVQRKKRKKLMLAKAISEKLSADREIWVSVFIQLIRYIC